MYMMVCRRKQEKVRGSSASDNDERGHWKMPVEFLLSALGYAIGLTSVYRFPYLAVRNGGGAFLVPYILFAVTFGLPLFFMESVLGQYFQRSPIRVFDICPLFKGIGIVMCLLSILVTIYYMTPMAWTLYFLYCSFSSTLPWTTCGNLWNTNSCLPLGSATKRNSTFNISEQFNFKPVLSTEEFWQNNVLGMSSGVEDVGTFQGHLVISLVITWTCVFLCIFKGINSSRIAVYITATTPFILLVILCAWSCTFPGAVDGILLYITPRWEKMGDYKVWLEAFMQVFYSVGASWGGIITLSSYNPFHHNCIRDSVIVTLTDTVTAIFCGFFVFTALGYMSHEAGVPILDVVATGPGLAFVTYPQVVASMPVSQLWASLFFALLFLLGIDGAFGMVKTLTIGLYDLFPERLSDRKALVTLVVCVLGFLIGLIFVTEGGIYYFQLCDWYLTFIALPLIGLLECIVVSYFYGIDRFLAHIKEMVGSVGKWFLFVIKYSLMFTAPVAVTILIIFTVVTFRSPAYGNYIYPEWTHTFGLILAIGLIPPIPGMMFYQLLKARGTLTERFRQSVKPTIYKRGDRMITFERDRCGEILLSCQLGHERGLASV